MNRRHLYAIPGQRDTLPAGVVSPMRAKQAPAVANVRPRYRPSVAGIPLYDHETEPATPGVALVLTELEWSLVVSALAERGQGNSLRVGSQPHAQLAAEVRAMVREEVRSRLAHPCTLPANDDTPPHGSPRPA